MLWFPRIMSNESAIENTFVPPWNGANPLSPSAQTPPPTSVEGIPQLTQSFVDCEIPPEFPQKLLMSAPVIPSFAAWQLRSPCDLMWLKIRLKPAVNWLMLRSLKIWVSDTATFRP